MDSKTRYQVDRLRRARAAAYAALADFSDRYGRHETPLLREDRFDALTEVIDSAEDPDPWLDAMEMWELFHRRFGSKASPTPSESTIAGMYLASHQGTVAELTRRYIEAARREPYRIWEVLSVVERESATLQCLTTRESVTLYDAVLTQRMAPWDLICGHVVGWDGVCVADGVSPFAVPAHNRPTIIKRLRGVKGSSGAELLPLQNKILNAYGQTIRELIDKPPPELRNTDNHVLVWTETRYRFAPKNQPALLRTVASNRDMDTMPDESPDASGVWHFSWFREGTDLGRTLLGNIRVGSDFLEFECNSRERCDELVRRLVAPHLTVLVLESATATPMDRPMLEEQARALAAHGAPDTPDISLDPAAAEVLDTIHMRWVDAQVPALGGLTPREAVRTAEGCQRVTDLLHEFENMDARARQPGYRFDYNGIRRALGLAEE